MTVDWRVTSSLVLLGFVFRGTSGLAAQSTTAAITDADLRTRVGIIAADSMLGRLKGGAGQVLVAEYMAREFRRLKLKPAGDRGSYFQEIPLNEILVDPESRLSVGGTAARLWEDFFPLHAPSLHVLPVQQAMGAEPLDSVNAIDGATVVFAGRIDDSTTGLTESQIAGRVVLFDAARATDGTRVFHAPEPTLAQPRFSGAAAVVIAQRDLLSPFAIEAFRRPWQTRRVRTRGRGPAVILVTPDLAERLLGVPLEQARPGLAGKQVAGMVRVIRRATAYPARNVIALLPGKEARHFPNLVLIGAHSDHTGIASRAYDHDSVRVAAWNAWAARIGTDTLRLAAPVFGLGRGRPDSVFNGADDNASGVAALMEIAEAMAKSFERPRRSVVFFSSGAEEGGRYGADWFLTHPTFPLASISSYINMEMIGRGARTPRNASVGVEVSYSEVPPITLIAHADSANRSLGRVANLTITGGGCGSDHANFNAAGIPAISFQARGDPDYHEVTDEAPYLNYEYLLAVSRLVRATAERVANAAVTIPRPTRPPADNERC